MKKSLSVTEIKIRRFCRNVSVKILSDKVATEAPLEIVLAHGESSSRRQKSISITMRTPGDADFDLVLGFLFSEGIINSSKDVSSVKYTANAGFDESLQYNTVRVDLYASIKPDLQRLERHFYTSSSCGVCGKASVDLVRQQSSFYPHKDFPVVEAEVLYNLPQLIRSAQSVFEDTGGLHASALFDSKGQLLCLREDVGRHNALDKLIGWALRSEMMPLKDCILMLSGRISFELVQKASMAGIPIVAAIGAPSSLAVELASESNITLIGFLRENRMNVYCGEERIRS
jgi:FdhD protein